MKTGFVVELVETIHQLAVFRTEAIDSPAEQQFPSSALNKPLFFKIRLDVRPQGRGPIEIAAKIKQRNAQRFVFFQGFLHPCFHILEVLMTGRGRILNKEQIIDHISEFDDELSASAVEIYISRLRKKLEPAGVGIRVVRGIGYILE